VVRYRLDKFVVMAGKDNRLFEVTDAIIQT